MKRRTFLKLAGFGTLSIAAGCQYRPENTLYSLVAAPDDMVTGKAAWYAGTCRECPAGCGVLAKNRDGRIVKIEGHPLHPINKGSLCMRGQAALQGLYNPDRVTTPLLKQGNTWKPISFVKAESILREKALDASAKGPGRVRMLTEVTGESLLSLFAQGLQFLNSPPPLVFETFSYDSLKLANQAVFDVDGLVSYRMDQADLLVSFGADFLETWLSPVEYARKFKAMHSISHGKKGAFIHIGPCQSLTAANADLWIPCRPGTEIVIAMGLIRGFLRSGKARVLSDEVRSVLDKITEPFTNNRVAELSGIDMESCEKLLEKLAASRNPLILPSGMAGSGESAPGIDMAANLLNVLTDPSLKRIDFEARHRVEKAGSRRRALDFFADLRKGDTELLLLNNVNPVYSLPTGSGAAEALGQEKLFVAAFSNFMDETASLADLIIPTGLALETWDEYAGKEGIVSMMQPAMGRMLDVPDLGNLFLRTILSENKPAGDFREYLQARLSESGKIKNELDWLYLVQRGGVFEMPSGSGSNEFSPKKISAGAIEKAFQSALKTAENADKDALTFMALPSIRFYDGRGANRPWLCEVPDTLTKVAWHTPVLIHPETLKKHHLSHEDVIRIDNGGKSMIAPVYETASVRPGVLAMGIGQGHETFGRYAIGMGLNPFQLLTDPPESESESGSNSAIPGFSVPVSISPTGNTLKLAHMDGSKSQHGRKIALSVSLSELGHAGDGHGGKHGPIEHGLDMETFPMALPIPEGYDKNRDFYPPHDHDKYRWAMVVDLDRCIGCTACSTACYAENNLGVVHLKGILEQREMSWLDIQRYLEPEKPEKITFLPMLCQHCDNAPCESVCPVYAPHHSKEGLNNQIYNRCIGTRFCSQNCPYKVRRFNWFTWKWPAPMNLQLNPDVTVRAKGVMEKCSFCVQRIKDAHGIAKDENREIRDGEIQPACLQTCPTGVFTFGSLMDKNSKVRKMVDDTRAYQIMGYLNTKPAVIYLKKVVQEI